ncbi:hypothetical protein E2C01_081651 [Portunus trituberculatus]|uniref:Uncharacterized protein n=1 Tax=Portunus trituberculatus TaxID=210409 RepID=A0A5B7IWG1_PORTR|nr:hypothetical protein [Portunus trituberculatus]
MSMYQYQLHKVPACIYGTVTVARCRPQGGIDSRRSVCVRVLLLSPLPVSYSPRPVLLSASTADQGEPDGASTRDCVAPLTGKRQAWGTKSPASLLLLLLLLLHLGLVLTTALFSSGGEGHVGRSSKIKGNIVIGSFRCITDRRLTPSRERRLLGPLLGLRT